MNLQETGSGTQMIMPGMLDRSSVRTVVAGGQLRPGVEVMYHGNIKGGPKFGATGIVQEVRGRRVVIDLYGWGIWHIPFYFLSTTLKAA